MGCMNSTSSGSGVRMKSEEGRAGPSATDEAELGSLPKDVKSSQLKDDSQLDKPSDYQADNQIDATTKVKDAPCVPTANKSPSSGGTNVQAKAADQGVAIDPGMFITQQKASLADRYIREGKLGSGAYGEVLLCRDKMTGAERAVKVIKKSGQMPTPNTTALLEEVAVVKQLDHPNIMKLYEFFEDKRNYYLVMDVYKGGELFDEIINRQRFSEADAASITKQVLSGVCYLHKHRIVHRDLKPENLLLETKDKDALIKIVDFGLSSNFDPNKKMKDRLGTAYYIAPEVLKKKYDEKCDIWAVGVILYILLCGYPPFGGSTDEEILRKVEKGKFTFDPPEWSKVSEDVKELIRQMLVYDPVKRVSAEAALGHKWICEMGDQKSAVDAPGLLNALGNMRKFRASQKLAQATLLFMGSKLTTIEETKELTEIFRSLDKNGDGQLDRKELTEGYVQLLKLRGEDGEDLTSAQIDEDVDRILVSVDFDQNGFIEYSEFVTVAMDKEILMSRERLKMAFNMFDTDQSGKIAADELRKLFDVTDDQWHLILTEVDKNNDGEVDFEEFVSMMQSLLPSQQQKQQES